MENFYCNFDGSCPHQCERNQNQNGICPIDEKTVCNQGVIDYCQSITKDVSRFPGIILNGMQITADGESKIVSYAAYVCKSAKEKSRAVIPNADEEHAHVVLSNLLKSARNKIEIYCSEQDLELFNQTDKDLRKSVHEFLRNPGSVQVNVLLEDCSDRSINILKKFRIPEQIKIKKISPEAKSLMKLKIGSGKDFHMILVDNQSYRYEYNTEKHEAICSFNDEPQCQQLSSIFSSGFNNSINLI